MVLKDLVLSAEGAASKKSGDRRMERSEPRGGLKVDLPELRWKVGGERIGSHLRSDRPLQWGHKFMATNADGPLGDRTLPPLHQQRYLVLPWRLTIPAANLHATLARIVLLC
jgi:hypothetical protein